MKDRRILITGAAGFIGSNIINKLVENNYIIGLDNLSVGKLENIKPFMDDKNFYFSQTNFTNYDSILPLMKDIDLIIHLGANSNVQNGLTNNLIDFVDNTVGTHTVLRAMDKMGVSEMIFASSSAIYGNAIKTPTAEDYGPLIPISNYGASKLAAESFVLSYRTIYGMKTTVYRFANVIGRKRPHGVIYDLYNKIIKDRDTLEILGDGSQSKSYIYIDECIDGIIKLHGKGDGIFNLGTKETTSVNKIVETFGSMMQISPRIVKKLEGPNGSGWLGDVKTIHLNIDKALSYGWSYKINSDKAVRMAIADMMN